MLIEIDDKDGTIKSVKDRGTTCRLRPDGSMSIISADGSSIYPAGDRRIASVLGEAVTQMNKALEQL